MVAFRYRTRIFYDHNNNVIKREIENRDSNNKELAGDWITYEFKYDILDNLIEETQEVSENPREIITKKYRYDRNENRVLEISPVANLPAGHPERQPSNVVSYVFDESDLLYNETRGGLTDQFKALAAHADIPELRQIPNSPDISTFARVYDLNKNLKEFIDGADNTGDGKPEVTTYLYDGFDRQVSVIDAVGNQSFTQYDPAGNVVRVSNFGPVGGKSHTYNKAANFKQPLKLEDFKQPLLSQVEFKYDELNRQFERNDKLFVYQGVEYKRKPVLQDGPLSSSNDGVVVTRFEYDRLGRRTFAIEDDLSTIQYRYDGAGRLIHEIDPTYSETIRVYDDNGNLVALTRIESSVGTDLPNLKEEFTTIAFYDSLNRPIRITYPLGYTERFQFDSRDNLILKSDPQASNDEMGLIIDPLPLGNNIRKAPKQADRINKPGNTVEYLYDGLNRKISEIYHLRVDGQGSNSLDKGNPSNPDGLIILDMKWDANSRLVARADDGSAPGDQNTSIGVIESTNAKGNVTRYFYDDLNRFIRQTFDDGSCETFEYDADNNIVRIIDANGTIVLNKFDGKNRLIERHITRGKSSDAHPLGCFKDASVAWSIVGTTRQEFQFDGLSRLTYAFDNNEPDDLSDDSRVEILYDSLNRIVEEKQNGQAISSQWMGDSNRTKLIYPTGYQLTYQYDRGDRMISISNPNYDHAIVKYAYIGPSRVLERIFSNGTRLTFMDKVRQSQVGYDAQNRIVKLQHLVGERLLAEFSYSYDRMSNKLSEKTSLGGKDITSEFKYDSIYQVVNAVSNEWWGNQQWVLDGVGNWHSHNNKSNTLNNLNQYVEFGTDKLKYDADGSLTEDGTYLYEYDFARRLKSVFNKADRTLVASMSYDALGRRTRISTRNNFTNFYYDFFKEIQEVKPNGSVQQYIFGSGADELLALEKDLNGDGIPEERYFYGEDGRHNVAFITDIKGAIVETMSYDPFGNFEIRNAQGARLRVSDVGNPYFFAGRRLDNETGLYYFRFRYYSYKYGGFLTRDPIDVEGSLIYNLYDYVLNNRLNYLDPMGLQPCSERELNSCLTYTKEFGEKERPREEKPWGRSFGISITVTICKKCCNDCSIKSRRTFDLTGNIEFKAQGRVRIYWVIYAEIYGSASASGRVECTLDECRGGSVDCCLTIEGAGRVGARIAADVWVARAGVGGELLIRCTLQYCIRSGLQNPSCCGSGRLYAFAEWWSFGWVRVEIDLASGRLFGSC
jgi:RHS repeat-associated protein